MKIFIEIIAVIICFSILVFCTISFKKITLKMKKIKAIKSETQTIKIGRLFLFCKKGDYPIEYVNKVIKKLNFALIINTAIFVVLFIILIIVNATCTF